MANLSFQGAELIESNFNGAIWNRKWKSPWRKIILRDEIEAKYGFILCFEFSEFTILKDKKCGLFLFCNLYQDTK